MHNPEFVSENKTHKILLDLKTQIDHVIPARGADLRIINKRQPAE